MTCYKTLALTVSIYCLSGAQFTKNLKIIFFYDYLKTMTTLMTIILKESYDNGDLQKKLRYTYDQLKTTNELPYDNDFEM